MAMTHGQAQLRFKLATMKKFLYMAVAAIAALSSCQNEDTILENNVQKESEKVFTATMENCAGTRTTLANNTPYWENTDKVCIIGSSGSGIYKATPDATNQAKATLTKESGDAPSQYMFAYYPANYVTMNSEQQVIATLPAVHAYNDGKFDMPMLAYAENENTSNLTFNNLCGVLAVTVKGISDIKAVRVISASATDKLSGHFALGNQSQDGKMYAVMKETDTSNQVSVNCGTGVDADATTGKVFYFPLAPATYGKLQVVVESGTSTVAHMTTPTGVTIERNKIYSTTFDDSKQNSQTEVLPIYATTKTAEGNPSSPFECVTLWSGSSIFATINVGQTNPYSSSSEYTTANVGDYFAWGETAPYYSSISGTTLTLKTDTPPHSSSYTGYDWQTYCGNASFTEWSTVPYENNTLKPGYDAATAFWGPVWRMPTKAELSHLINKSDDGNSILSPAATTCTWCDGSSTQYASGCTLKGYKIEGNGNSMFLPAAGYCENSTVNNPGLVGYYWASTHSNNYLANYLSFDSGALAVGGFGSRYNGNLVRAVLK